MIRYNKIRAFKYIYSETSIIRIDWGEKKQFELLEIRVNEVSI